MTLHGTHVFQMNGLGNKILLVDWRTHDSLIDPKEVIQIHHMPRLSFDQMMVLRAPKTAGTEAFVQIFNSDGSEARACGNGTRCVAWYLSRETKKSTFTIETVAGILTCEQESEWEYRVDMGEPRLDWKEIPLSKEYDTLNVPVLMSVAIQLPHAVCVNMGNPHAVFFVDDVAKIPLEDIGPLLERHYLFPDRANISFVQVIAPDHLLQRVWERGAGITQACGTGACAALVAAVRRGLSDRKARVTLPGGDLHIAWRENNHVMLQGPVVLERELVFILH
ncbi:MAG: diaminopimelate epimerase [Candidatus Parcubacteria bacterium]|jgi:diaminopimelate epimerase